MKIYADEPSRNDALILLKNLLDRISHYPQHNTFKLSGYLSSNEFAVLQMAFRALKEVDINDASSKV